MRRLETVGGDGLTGGRIGYLAEPLNLFRFHEASVRHKSMEGRATAAATPSGDPAGSLERVTPTEAVREKLCETILVPLESPL